MSENGGRVGTAPGDTGDRLRVRGISIICVFNDIEVRRECLDRSIEAYRGELEVDYRPVDNRAQQFTSAGAALNHGARDARHDVIVFVHQDVYLHSLDRLAEVGRWLSQPPTSAGWHMLGASGVTGAGVVAGRLRDRVQLIGAASAEPQEVESLDEVLFMVSREQVVKEPLTEDPDLAWHAYAVEYGQRLRASGRRVGAVDLAITHNSLTVNLARLDAAHRAVGARYPDLRPIHTTCGTIADQRRRLRDLPVVRDHRWRLRWLRHSLLARSLRRKVPVRAVLSDIRHEVDLLAFSCESPLFVVNVDPSGAFAAHAPHPLALSRLGKPVVFRAVRSRAELVAAVENLSASARVLITDVGLADIEELHGCCGDRRWIIGIQPDALWMLGGDVVGELPPEWSRRQAIPLGQARA